MCDSFPSHSQEVITAALTEADVERQDAVVFGLFVSAVRKLTQEHEYDPDLNVTVAVMDDIPGQGLSLEERRQKFRNRVSALALTDHLDEDLAAVVDEDGSLTRTRAVSTVGLYTLLENAKYAPQSTDVERYSFNLCGPETVAVNQYAGLHSFLETDGAVSEPIYGAVS